MKSLLYLENMTIWRPALEERKSMLRILRLKRNVNIMTTQLKSRLWKSFSKQVNILILTRIDYLKTCFSYIETLFPYFRYFFLLPIYFFT